MNLQQAFNFLNLAINKYTGSWYTIPELEQLVDRGQIAYYSDIKAKYATSQLVKDILSPFRTSYNFTTQVSGVIIIPDDNYLDLLDIQIYFNISNRVVYAPVKLVNEDERAIRLNSQINPVTITSPIGEQISKKTFRLYPVGTYNGNVTYLRRPVAPVFSYTVISGRVIVYDNTTSTQLEWRETEIVPILLKSLRIIGINLRDNEVLGFSEQATSLNYQGVNRL